MLRTISRLALLVPVLGAEALIAQRPGLSVKRMIQLTPATDGFAGRLELLEDARITPALDKKLWQSGGPDMALDENDPLAKQLAAHPVCPAVLRLRDAQGNVAAEKNLKREQARLEVHQLHPGYRSIFVTTDLSAGFGSYPGPFTRILDLSRGSLNFLRARDPFKKTSEILTLASTLKASWILVGSPARAGPGREILQVACRPDRNHPNSDKFLISYTRYSWTGTEWVVAKQDRSGFWEADQPFPSFGRFPAISHESD